MDNNLISKTVGKQRLFFQTQKTKDINFRLENLKKLRDNVLKNEEYIYEALYKDFGKSSFETYTSELGIFLEEINYHIKNLKKWSKPLKVATPFAFFPAKSYIYPEPYGVVLIISPWNYPFLLLMNPLVGAISSGNCAILKPADYSKNTSIIIKKIINDSFSPEYISIFTGGRDVNKELLKEKYDYIFFTGSPSLAKEIMAEASKNLTPLTLELGGKSPCIIDENTDIKTTALRSVWGKFFNCGQTCVAPDYFFVNKNIKNEFIELLKKSITLYYGVEPKNSPDYPRIINEKHFDRLVSLINKSQVVFGGDFNKNDKYISPTIIDNVKSEDAIMQEEIFGPIIPILEYTEISEVIDFINSRPKPLALYFFSKDKQMIKRVLKEVSFGGGTINDVIIHAGSKHLPFGGVGNSGMGSYHGKKSFDTFTHYKSIVKNIFFPDIKLRYPPYKNKLKIAKLFIK